MHNLENDISKWRQQLLAGGVNNTEVLDELESHLREDVEEQVRSGINQEAAFGAASRRIGKSELLEAEFAKVARSKQVRPVQVIGIACCVFGALYSILLAPHLFTIRELTPGQRILGLAAVALALLSTASWRFSYRYLPEIRSLRTRKMAGILCGFAGLAWVLIFACLLPNVIVPHFLNSGASAESIRGSVLVGLRQASPEGFRPVFMIGISILWAMAFTAVLGGIAYGLEEAARRRFQKDVPA